jgi:flagellar protein FliS
MFSNGYGSTGGGHYQANAVSTASPGQLVTILYDAALAAVARAHASLTTDDGVERIQRSHTDLTKAQDIILELQLSLDHDQGGQIAGSLSMLYDFCLDRLVTANTRKDPDLLPAVSEVLGELRSGWVSAVEENAA